MQTPDVHALTGAYVLDALSVDEKTGFEVHLDGCHPCTIDVAELTETVARLGTVVAQPVPPRLKAGVLAEVGRTRQLPPLVPHVVEIRRRRRRVMLAAAAAVLAVVAGAGGAGAPHPAGGAGRQGDAGRMTGLPPPDGRGTHRPAAAG